MLGKTLDLSDIQIVLAYRPQNPPGFGLIRFGHDLGRENKRDR
jgi:hypothetical protein